MNISPELIKTLREKTGAGIMDCKKALAQVEGNVDKAIDYLRKKGLAQALKKASRATSEGLVSSYIHAGGKIGVLVEVNCETDFVARTEEFQSFVKDIAMHVAATNPLHVRREDIPKEVLDAEREVYRSQAKEMKKPEAVIEKIVEGKMNSFCQENCLMEQAFVKNPDKTVKDITTEVVAKLGENISICRFARFQLGETSNS